MISVEPTDAIWFEKGVPYAPHFTKWKASLTVRATTPKLFSPETDPNQIRAAASHGGCCTNAKLCVQGTTRAGAYPAPAPFRRGWDEKRRTYRGFSSSLD